MKLNIIKTHDQYKQYLDWVDVMFDKKIKANSADGEKLQVVLLLINNMKM